jgi:hypothetical protein
MIDAVHQSQSRLPLIAAVNHAADGLGLLCDDVSDCRQLAALLETDPGCWQRAKRFVYCYELLEAHHAAETDRVHWLRRPHAGLGTTPFLAMVDDVRLEDVIAALNEE